MFYSSWMRGGKTLSILSRLCVWLLLGATLGLAGCAVSVKKSDDSALKINKASRKQITMNVTGSQTATASKDWQLMSDALRDAMASAASAIDATFSLQKGKPRPTGQTGTLLVVDIKDFRYLSETARYLAGIMTGNAFVDASVQFKDLRTGTAIGERTFNTSSSAWEGIFSAMTDKQVRAIATEIADEIHQSSDAPAPAGAAAVDSLAGGEESAGAAAPQASVPAVQWRGLMACDARKDSGATAAAYQAKFDMEVAGSAVTLHRQNANVRETLSGDIEDGAVDLHGIGYRLANKSKMWQLRIQGAFLPDGNTFSGKGNMLLGAKPIRNCDLTMVKN
ncbi:MAG TPA: hypothetical protein VGN04_14545 [Herbaspirillum sp.]|jgi:hypothetical protein